MIKTLSSHAKDPSKKLKPVPREKDEDNIHWLSRNLPAGKLTTLVMVGGKSQTAFRLRVAQSQLRDDLVPSYWSHAFMVESVKNLAESPVHEISLEPRSGFGFPPPGNAVQTGTLGRYGDPGHYPNIVVLGVPVKPAEAMKSLERFKKQRAVLDAVDLLVRWLSYVWAVGRSGNPLLDGFGIPSAAMLEIVFGAAGYDLTPGLESRSSCPEAIWQAAKWWHEYYERDKRPALTGAYFTPHSIFEEPDEKKS